MGGDQRDRLIRSARDHLRQGEATLDLLTLAERAGQGRTDVDVAFGSAKEGGGLEALRIAVAASGFEDLAKELESARDRAPDPEEGLRGVGQAYLSFAENNPALFRLMFGPEAARGIQGDRRRSGEQDAGRLIEARRRTQRVIVRAVQGCQEHGAHIPMSAEKAGLAGWTMLHGAGTLLIDGQFPLIGLDIAGASSLMLDLLVSHPVAGLAGAAESFAAAQADRASAVSPEPQRPSPPPPAREKGMRSPRAAKPEPASAKPSASSKPAAPPPETGKRSPPTKAAPADRAPAPASRASTSSKPTSAKLLFDTQPVLRRLRRNTDVLRNAAVLWIDDRPELSRAEEALLRRLNAEIHRVEDTDEALAYSGLGAMPIDLVISDIARPRSHRAGLDDLPKVREAFPHSPVIFYVRSVEGRGGVPEGAAGLTSSPEELLHLILDVLERTRS